MLCVLCSDIPTLRLAYVEWKGQKDLGNRKEIVRSEKGERKKEEEKERRGGRAGNGENRASRQGSAPWDGRGCCWAERSAAKRRRASRIQLAFLFTPLCSIPKPPTYTSFYIPFTSSAHLLH